MVGFAAYLNGLDSPFIYDDVPAIEENEFIRQLWPPSVFFQAPENSPVAGRPVVSLTLAVNYALGGLDVVGYHVFNLLLHVGCALLLFGVVRRTLLGERLRSRFGDVSFELGFASALLWMLHPLHTEVIDYATQRTESLMGFFYLATLYAVIRAHDARRGGLWTAGAIVSCALGMAAKESMVTAPLAVLLYDSLFLMRSPLRALRARPALYGGLVASWGVLVALMWSGPRAASIGFSHGISALQYAGNQAEMLTTYLLLAFWPHPLVIDYGRPQAVTPGEVALPALGLAVLLGATLVALWRRPPLGFLGAWFFLLLVPTSSFVPIVTEVGAERRMYLSLAALVVGVVIAAHAVLRRLALPAPAGRQVGTVLTLVTAAILGLVTLGRNADYDTAVSIWQTAVEARPDNPRAIANLGEAVHGEGRLDEAIALYRRALEMDPERAVVHYNLGNALRSQGDRKAAVRQYLEAVRIDPDYARAHNNLANEFQLLGKLDLAITHYRRALEIQPRNAKAHYNLGEALRQQGELDAAIAEYRQAASIGVEMRPFAEASTALILATHSEPERRKPLEAVRLAEQAADATGHANPSLLMILSVTYASAGRTEEALRSAERALSEAESQGQLGLAQAVRAHLQTLHESARTGPG